MVWYGMDRRVLVYQVRLIFLRMGQKNSIIKLSFVSKKNLMEVGIWKTNMTRMIGLMLVMK